MLTAAVRDLHKCYPNQFLTDVRTPCPHLWENNPCITPLAEPGSGAGVLPVNWTTTDQDHGRDTRATPETRGRDARATFADEVIECHYPLIQQSNQVPYHFIHGFVEFLNERLRLQIKPTAFKGDIHISKLEKSWISQVQEITREDTPFWIVVAGGKRDFTIKWWDLHRFQQVVDHFRGKIVFVQVGEKNHNHFGLDGVIDLRGCPRSGPNGENLAALSAPRDVIPAIDFRERRRDLRAESLRPPLARSMAPVRADARPSAQDRDSSRDKAHGRFLNCRRASLYRGQGRCRGRSGTRPSTSITHVLKCLHADMHLA